MKTIIVLLLSCFLVFSCSKKDHSNEGDQEKERQEVFSQEILIQEVQKPDASYVFDIDSFRYLDEFPRTIAGVKELYPDEPFEEKTSENWGKGPMGEYVYSLRSPGIRFGFWGDTIEGANLLTVEILLREYQCKNIQVIGMSAEELELVSGIKLNRDKRIILSTELYVLSIETKDGIVNRYTILMEL